jgi:outer membrane protein assembly factor BamB
MKNLLLLILCFFPLTIKAQTSAQNWPSFRGVNASGVVDTKLPTTWDVAKSQNVLWKTTVPGLGHASPVVWGNQIFVITAISSDPNPGFIAKDRGISLSKDETKHTWHIYAIDKRNGRVLWEQKAYEGVPRAKRHVKATQANSTPVTDGRYVVALFGSEGLAAYDTNGKLLWKQDLGVLNPGLWDDKNSSWGHSSSPIIFRDLVIVQADGHKQSFIAAFNLKTGKQAWRVERDEITSWATPVIYQGKNRTELIANGGRYIRGYDPLTGKELWRFSDSNTQVKMQAPQISNDLIYVTGGYPPGRTMWVFRPGAVGDISLKSGETKNDYIAWSSTSGSPYTPTPLIYGDLFYALADNGVLSAYEAGTGVRVYQQRLPTSFSASPVAADGKLFLASEDGDVLVVKTGREFEVLAKNALGQPLMATPAITQGMLILRGENTIWAVGQK